MTTIGKDLEKIRIAQGLTIEDIHHATKISVLILQTIENGTLFEDVEQANTYVRSYVRSYGRALKIDDQLLIKALDQQETGNYNQLLLENYESLLKDGRKGTFTLDTKPEEKSPEKGVSPEGEATFSLDAKNHSKSPGSTDEKRAATDNRSGKKPAESDLSTKTVKPTRSIQEKDVDWADMGHKFHSPKKRMAVWPFLVGILVIALFGIAAYFFYQQSTENSQSESGVNGVGQALDSSLQDSPVVPETTDSEIQLDEILYITVYAAYAQLDPVRIWSDLKPRLDPYWIEMGTAMVFEFENMIRIRGQYSNLLLFKNGHLISDPLSNHFNEAENSIEITRDLFTDDSKWSSPVDFELPDNVAAPDTVMSRPVFN